MELKEGEAAYYDGKQYQKGLNPEYGTYAPADTFVVGKNGPRLEAFGGGCTVVSYYDGGAKIGIIMHIHAAEVFGNQHEELIGQMLKAHPDLARDTEIHLFVDTESEDPDVQPIRNDIIAWKERIIGHLRAQGFLNISEFTQGDGKDVMLDTRTGIIQVLDDRGKLIFEKK